MNLLRQAFALLRDFASLPLKQKRVRISKLDSLLRAARSREKRARLAVRELDQLRKQRAYMLVVSGKVAAGIKQSEDLVAELERGIADLHDEAAFQLSEAALAAFRSGRQSTARALTRRALSHAGMAGRLSKTLLQALDHAAN